MACSNDLCAPFVLIAPFNPAVFKGCSDGVGSPVCLWPHSLGVPHSTEAHGDRPWQNHSLQPPAPSHSLQSSASLPRVGRAFPLPRCGVTKCQPMAPGSPCRAPTSPLLHGAAGVKAHPSILHPLTAPTRPPLAPSVSQPSPGSTLTGSAQGHRDRQRKGLGGCMLLQRMGSPCMGCLVHQVQVSNSLGGSLEQHRESSRI